MSHEKLRLSRRNEDPLSKPLIPSSSPPLTHHTCILSCQWLTATQSSLPYKAARAAGSGAESHALEETSMNWALILPWRSLDSRNES